MSEVREHTQPCDCAHCRRRFPRARTLRGTGGSITLGDTTLNLSSLQVTIGPPRQERRPLPDEVDALRYMVEGIFLGDRDRLR